MVPSPKHYLESLDTTQLAQLILALMQHGLVLAPATLPTGSGAPYSATCIKPSHSDTTTSLSGSGTTPGVADMAVATVPAGFQHPGKQAEDGCPILEASMHAQMLRLHGIWLLNTIALSVLNVDSTVYLPHASHAAACAHYASTMANNQVKIVLTDDEDDS
ncbi:hypothetical protein EDD18DRAFT_1355856 [Armillaria luteobubalina]|uniref:Uncharacterized protein n=1 Tax=Armillaria luteobubalina TaxID=153913 RepID=A0AA39Q221_9AGAR|nr:hypothetical protein EDD18DRAFT_1355856 [Armillaria luteobubalina]